MTSYTAALTEEVGVEDVLTHVIEGIPVEIYSSLAPNEVYDPNWSPDGTRVIFVEHVRAVYQICTILVGATYVKEVLYKSLYPISDPSYSADGYFILFAEETVPPDDTLPYGQHRLRWMKEDGSDVTTILDDGNANMHPTWTTPHQVAFQWWHEGNQTEFYRSITVDSTKCGTADSSDFPVMVSGTYTYLRTVENGGDVQNASGYDIRFFADSGLTTLLDFERESYDPTTGAVVFWVKLPTLSESTDTVIYLNYGNASVITDQSNAAGVWGNSFTGVYHLGDGVTLDVTSSTGANNGTNQGAAASSGKIGGSADLTGSKYIDFGTGSIDSQILTHSAWVYCTDVTAFSYITGGTGNGTPTLRRNPTTRFLEFAKQNQALIGISSGTVPDNTWTHVAVTYDVSGNYVFYINGASAGSGTSLQTFTLTNTFRTGSPSNDFKGKVDELHLANAVRTSSWIVSEYNNQSSPSTFYSVGTATPVSDDTSSEAFAIAMIDLAGNGRIEMGEGEYPRLVVI